MSIKAWQPGQLTADGTRQEMPEVSGESSHDKFKSLANAYGLDASLVWQYEDKWNLKEGTILCIAIAETSGGKFGAGEGNIGNVGNNDRGDRVSFGSLENSLNAIGQTLNNKYLGEKQTLGCLSNAGNCREEKDNGKRYATSNGNRERNMSACLGTIYGQADFSFNIRK